MVVSSAQLRAARAYLNWTMERAAEASSLHRRTIIRLEGGPYAESQPPSLRKMVATYRQHGIVLEGTGLTLADDVSGTTIAERDH